MVDSMIVRAIASVTTAGDIRAWKAAAVQSLMGNLPRVVTTGVNFEAGGSQGIFVDKDPKEVIAYCEAVEDYWNAANAGTEAASGKQVYGDLRGRCVGW